MPRDKHTVAFFVSPYTTLWDSIERCDSPRTSVKLAVEKSLPESAQGHHQAPHVLYSYLATSPYCRPICRNRLVRRYHMVEPLESSMKNSRREAT